MQRKGRRLYDNKCIEVIKKIKYMLYYKGYTIKGMQREFDSNIRSGCDFSNLLQRLTNLRDYYLISKIDSEKSNEYHKSGMNVFGIYS
nr:MerR family transcriptional regulator [Wolbachia endosymbiont of Litomosoides sigmodontis]